MPTRTATSSASASAAASAGRRRLGSASSPDGLGAPLPSLEDADALHPEPAQELERPLVGEPDLVGSVGVRGEGELGAGLDAHLGEGGRRIDLADVLAQAGRRDLDRDAALGHRLDRGLVVGARIPLGQRPGIPPQLHQVGVGEDVEQARARDLGDPLEVASARARRDRRSSPRRRSGCRPPRRRRPGSGPSRPRSRSPGPRAGSRSGPRRRGRSRPRCRASAGSCARTRSRRPGRRAPGSPRRGCARLQRLGEAIDVLGDAQLGDPPPLGGGQVAARRSPR